MIPAIGYMVACYIITRMFSLLTKKKDGNESTITNILAGVTIVVALFGIYVLVTGELSTLDFGDLLNR
jgi:hypothetical protein